MGLFKRKRQKQETQEAVLTIYTCRPDLNNFKSCLEEVFSEHMAGQAAAPDGGIDLTLQDNTSIHFSIEDDPKELSAQTNGMANYFAQAPLENEQVREGALRQILLFNHIIGIGFTVNEDSNRTNYLVNAIYELASKLNGFVLHPNMYLYQSDGKLLISIDGKTDLEQFYPTANVSIPEHELPEEQADLERKERSIQKCRQMGLNYLENLHVSVLETKCEIPSVEEIIHRLACIFAAAVCAEACNYNSKQDAERMVTDMLASLEEQYQISQYLSDEERTYTKNPLAYTQLAPQFGWRYECCIVLLWAIGLWELTEPTQICDAAEVGKILWKNDFNSLKEKAVPKSKQEILDMQDLIYRYDWACVDARIHNQQLTVIDGEIVQEWHYALNWLTSAYGIKDWDKVTPHT